MRDCSWVPGSFEKITSETFKCISDRTVDTARKYNCIAWAAGKSDKWWWPRGLPREPLNRETIENFVEAFRLEGYERCDDGLSEGGFEKVAIYVNYSNVPKHAARLLPSGVWTSKLGDLEDIEHATLDALEGDVYGKAKVFLKRRVRSSEGQIS
jgi:hypothetical protein